MESFLLQSFIYLAAATLFVPIAKFLNLGSVLGFLLAGIVIGPVLGLVGGSETQSLQHFAEFGVVMMLFLVGLELEPQKLWQLRHRLFGLGGMQVVVTTILVMLFSMYLGYGWQTGLMIGMVLSLSSTAIVLQTLSEKGLMKTDGGQSSFSVLLFQDIAVIPMLAIVPLLAVPELIGLDLHSTADTASHVAETATMTAQQATETGHNINTEVPHAAEGDHHGEAGHGASMSLVNGLPPLARTALVLGAVGFLIFAGNYLLQPFFNIIARTRLPELFTIAGLLLIIGIALLMHLVGLSPALGTFMAGMLLANSEFRHELESTIEPFKGILLGLFFITVGAGIDFGVLSNNFALIIGLTLGLLLLKGTILFCIGSFFKMRPTNKFLFSMALAQAGEFGFVLLAFGEQNNAVPFELGKILALIIAISMLLTPVLFILYEKWLEPKLSHNDDQEEDVIDETGDVILAGAGRFGQIIYRLLSHNHHKQVVIDNHISQIELLRQFGIKSFYGDPSKPELLLAAGIADAKLFIVGVDDKLRSIEMVKYCKKNHPHVKVFARALDRTHYYDLAEAGADIIIRDTFHSALEMSRHALTSLGMHPALANRQVNTFRTMDESHLEELRRLWMTNPNLKENLDYRSYAKKANELLREALEHDKELEEAEDH